MLLAVVVGACAEAPAPGVTVDHVFDGDSFSAVTQSGQPVEVRLRGIDAPERDQPHADASRRALDALIGGQPLELDVVETDRFGRQVAHARLGDRRDVAAWLVGNGHAWVYDRYNDDPALVRLQREARTARRGLWAAREAPVPPWQWRAARRD